MPILDINETDCGNCGLQNLDDGLKLHRTAFLPRNPALEEWSVRTQPLNLPQRNPSTQPTGNSTSQVVVTLRKKRTDEWPRNSGWNSRRPSDYSTSMEPWRPHFRQAERHQSTRRDSYCCTELFSATAIVGGELERRGSPRLPTVSEHSRRHCPTNRWPEEQEEARQSIYRPEIIQTRFPRKIHKYAHRVYSEDVYSESEIGG